MGLRKRLRVLEGLHALRHEDAVEVFARMARRIAQLKERLSAAEAVADKAYLLAHFHIHKMQTTVFGGVGAHGPAQEPDTAKAHKIVMRMEKVADAEEPE